MAVTRSAKKSSKSASGLSAKVTSKASPKVAPKAQGKYSGVSLDDHTEPTGPLACADALGRTAAETCRQHERLARLMDLRVQQDELEAAHALVDTCDLALAECVAAFEKGCGKMSVSEDADVRQKASALWLAAREYLRRHSIAEKASRQLTQHDAEKLGDLQREYELEASALLALKHATTTFGLVRADAK